MSGSALLTINLQDASRGKSKMQKSIVAPFVMFASHAALIFTISCQLWWECLVPRTAQDLTVNSADFQEHCLLQRRRVTANLKKKTRHVFCSGLICLYKLYTICRGGLTVCEQSELLWLSSTLRKCRKRGRDSVGRTWIWLKELCFPASHCVSACLVLWLSLLVVSANPDYQHLFTFRWQESDRRTQGMVRVFVSPFPAGTRIVLTKDEWINRTMKNRVVFNNRLCDRSCNASVTFDICSSFANTKETKVIVLWVV